MQYEQMIQNYTNGNAHIRPLQFELDNAAKIFPSTIGKNQHHIYRMSMTLCEKVDKEVLQSALEVTIHRFPSIAARLRRGIFWYWLESVEHAPVVQPENEFLMKGMTERDLSKYCFRVIYGENTIIVEFFHAICDGSGAMVFLKSLIAEYLEQKYNKNIPCGVGVLNRMESPKLSEIEDCYSKYAGPKAAERTLSKAYRLAGTVEKDGMLHISQIKLDVDQARICAKKHGLTLTELFASALISSITDIQKNKLDKFRNKPILIAVSINLRKFFACLTLRNFSLSATVGIDPQQGKWSFDEIGKRVHHQLATLVTKKEMEAATAANVQIERVAAFRWMPLFLKNAMMKGAYSVCGINSCCLSLSNLGAIDLPDEMKPYVTDISCCMDANRRSTNSCAVLSYNGTLYINFCRSIKETRLEQGFCNVLKSLGLDIKTRAIITD